ncbi:unnamed protein product [Clonostachys rhizophaga]|uniref:Uncharacterized protein n=1 Tax=Clonostachys rhizophaga TaxID=160324 RepID=A0A9N9W499_9HYPO|nr:unnamed protein product [Clonostachys rhizophaga]
MLRPNLQRLESWRESLPAHMVSETGNNTNERIKSLPFKRSLAKMHLRFNHCIILLLWPLILRQVPCIFSDEKLNTTQEDLEYINNNCLRSARLNVLIMINVQSAGLIINARRPGSFKETPDDIKTYQSGKSVLTYMMKCGTLAARGYLSMVKKSRT